MELKGKEVIGNQSSRKFSQRLEKTKKGITGGSNGAGRRKETAT